MQANSRKFLNAPFISTCMFVEVEVLITHFVQLSQIISTISFSEFLLLKAIALD